MQLSLIISPSSLISYFCQRWSAEKTFRFLLSEGGVKAPADLGEAAERSIFQTRTERAEPHPFWLNKQWGYGLIKAR